MRQKKSQEAWKLLAKMRNRMKRDDVPYYNLVKGDLWMELHQPDSAMKHWRIATETGNGFMASQAFERMGDRVVTQVPDEAFGHYLNSLRVWNDLYLTMDNRQRTLDFEELELKNQLAGLKLEHQKHTILILGLALFIVVLTTLYNHSSYNLQNMLSSENLLVKSPLQPTLLHQLHF